MSNSKKDSFKQLLKIKKCFPEILRICHPFTSFYVSMESSRMNKTHFFQMYNASKNKSARAEFWGLDFFLYPWEGTQDPDAVDVMHTDHRAKRK